MVIAIAGSTGLTGNLCLAYLLKHAKVDRVFAVVRKKTDAYHPKLNEVLLDDTEALDRIKAHAFICCLGTTIRKAGSRSAFAAVDLDLPLFLAKKFRSNGCHSIAVISAMGANPTSSIFYNRIKGEMEQAMQKIGVASLSIMRPSIIDGDRKETRIMEKIGIGLGKLIGPVLSGSWKHYRVISANDLAKALCNGVFVGRPGLRVYLSEDIKKLAAI